MSQRNPHTSGTPAISVIMANHEGGRYIGSALDSVLGQTFSDLEVIVSDDASGDDSVAQIRAAAMRDGRVKLIEADRNGGPGRSRNRALDLARGDWIAIVDSDDLIHPERFARLLAAAERSGTAIVADDLLHFHDDGSAAHYLLPEDQATALDVTAPAWILAGGEGTPPLGYLKPMIRASLMKGVRYDESLRIGEDFDMVLRLLLAGATLHVVPEPWYLYRRHGRSISHRLSIKTVGGMIDSQLRFVAAAGPFDAAVAEAFERRLNRLRKDYAFEELVAAAKARSVSGVLGRLAKNPSLALALIRSLREHISAKGEAAAEPPAASATVRLSGIPTPEKQGGRRTIVVPPYPLVDSPAWGGAARRKAWLGLADLARSHPLRVVCEDAAGSYAAGFIPGPPLSEAVVASRLGEAASNLALST